MLHNYAFIALTQDAITPITYSLPIIMFAITCSPLLLISSKLYSWTLSFVMDPYCQIMKTLTIIELVIVLIIISELFSDRRNRRIFFVQFFFIGCYLISFTIGILYFLLEKESVSQQAAAKLCGILFFIYITEKYRVRAKGKQDDNCQICHDKLNKKQIMKLKCGHYYHEECLWNWISYRMCCPKCTKPLRQFNQSWFCQKNQKFFYNIL